MGLSLSVLESQASLSPQNPHSEKQPMRPLPDTLRQAHSGDGSEHPKMESVDCFAS